MEDSIFEISTFNINQRVENKVGSKRAIHTIWNYLCIV